MTMNTFTSGIDTTHTTKLNQNFARLLDYFNYNTYMMEAPTTTNTQAAYWLQPSVAVYLSSGSILRTTNGVTFGATGTVADPGNNYLTFDAINSNYMCMGCATSTIINSHIASTDGGATWLTITTPTLINGADISYTGVKCAINPNNRLFCISTNTTRNPALFTSTNMGSSWTELLRGTTTQGTSSVNTATYIKTLGTGAVIFRNSSGSSSTSQVTSVCYNNLTSSYYPGGGIISSGNTFSVVAKDTNNFAFFTNTDTSYDYLIINNNLNISTVLANNNDFIVPITDDTFAFLDYTTNGIYFGYRRGGSYNTGPYIGYYDLLNSNLVLGLSSPVTDTYGSVVATVPGLKTYSPTGTKIYGSSTTDKVPYSRKSFT